MRKNLKVDMINTKLQGPYNFQINLISNFFKKKIVFWKFYCLKSSSLSLWPEIHLSGTNWHSTNLHLKVESTKTKQNKTCRLLLYCNTLFSVSSSFYFFLFVCFSFLFLDGWWLVCFSWFLLISGVWPVCIFPDITPRCCWGVWWANSAVSSVIFPLGIPFRYPLLELSAVA